MVNAKKNKSSSATLLKLSSILKLEDNTFKLRYFLLFMLLSFIFSFSVRLIWVGIMDSNPNVSEYRWNNELMITTNDGYFFAQGARDILNKVDVKPADLSPVKRGLSILTAFFARILPLSFESIILYMSAFMGSLIVIPILLISRLFKQDFMGLLAALIGSIAWSYYNRTMVGYYDTDMLVIVFALCLTWSLMATFKSRKLIYLAILALFILVYRWYYPQSYSLIVALILFFAIYILIFDRKNIFNYQIIAISLVSLASFGIYIKIALLLILFALMYVLSKRYDAKKNSVLVFCIVIAIFSLLIVFATGGLNPIWVQLKAYVVRQSVSEGSSLHFLSVGQTIREAGEIPFLEFAKRISGGTGFLLLSMLGYLLLVIAYPIAILMLPMLSLGILSYGIPGIIQGGGLRFTIYATPIMAISLAYAYMLIVSFISYVMIKSYKTKIYLKYGLASFLTIFPLWAHVEHVREYIVPTVFLKNEVEVLNKLSNISKREDYVVAWWDYGYPIRYYGDIRTLIDGGRHNGDVNFPVSFALSSSSQVKAINMMRLNVEYAQNTRSNGEGYSGVRFIEDSVKKYKKAGVNEFLESLDDKNFKLPKKTRDIYLYLPYRMLSILPTVTSFSNLDIVSGDKFTNPFFYTSSSFKEEGNVISFKNNISFLKNTGTLRVAQQIIPVNSLIVVGIDDKRSAIKYNELSNIYIIFLKKYGTFAVLDKSLYDSLYVQLFLLNNYDKNLFEPVLANNLVKVFKLKK